MTESVRRKAFISAAEKVRAYHHMRPAKNLEEHIANAAMLGLPLDAPDRRGVTLRMRLTAFWEKGGFRGRT